MSLEGLRAWIGEVERKLGKRTRVFLALAVIAIGLGGAAIYLAIDARESSVSESDVQELQRQLEAQIDEATAGSALAPAPEPVEPTEPEPAPEAEPKSGGDSDGDRTGGVGAGGAPSGGGSPGGAGSEAPRNADSARIQELLEQAKEQNAEAEAEQAGK
jgi:hypothetical protein